MKDRANKEKKEKLDLQAAAKDAAKHADATAATYAKNKLKETAMYKNAKPETQKILEANAIADTVAKSGALLLLFLLVCWVMR